MAHYSKFDRDPRRSPTRPESAAGEFVAPTGAPRPRGASRYEGAVPPPPPKPAPDESPAGDVTDSASVEGSRSGPTRHDEIRICGLAAVRARFARDPKSIKRLFFDRAMAQRVGVISRVLAQEKKIYRMVEPSELEKISGSIHHGGIVAVVSAMPVRLVSTNEVARWAKRGEAVLVLDRIGNAHNLGAIARTAAFFGVPRLVIAADASSAKPTDAAHRVAEGGFESLEVWQSDNLVTLASDLSAAGFQVIGAATRGGRVDAPRPTGVERKPVALVLGNEEQGLAPALADACTQLVTLPGSGKVESLNVSVAAAVLMWEFFGRRK